MNATKYIANHGDNVPHGGGKKIVKTIGENYILPSILVLDANLRIMKLNISLILVIAAHIITQCFGNLFASEYTPLLGELSHNLRPTQDPLWNN